MSEHDTPIEGEIVPVQQTGLSLGSLPMANPAEIVQRATEVAKVLTKVIKDQRLSKNIQGREYVYVTGWSTLGAMLGIMARETPGGTYAREDGSYVGSVDLIRVSDGMVIGGGTAVVGMDERDAKGTQTWGSRPEYARRSMAVTRAAGKAYRLTLAWIMALAGFEGTPAEEMDGLNLQEDGDNYSKPRPKAPQTRQNPPEPTQGAQGVSAQAETPTTSQRPFEAHVVKGKLATTIKKYSLAAEKPASKKQIEYVASLLSKAFQESATGEQDRHLVQKWLTGEESATKFNGAQAKALIDWLTDESGDLGEEGYQEAWRCLNAALEESGQMRLEIPAGPIEYDKPIGGPYAHPDNPLDEG